MGAIAALALGGTAVGVAGSLAMAKAQQKAALYNAAVARQNGRLAREKAQRDSLLVREAGFKNLGAIRASVGASGITVEGSVTDVLSESARNIKREEMNTIYQGELAARGFEIEARQAIFQGNVAKAAGMFNAASTVLQGAGAASTFSNLGGGGGSGLSRTG